MFLNSFNVHLSHTIVFTANFYSVLTLRNTQNCPEGNTANSCGKILSHRGSPESFDLQIQSNAAIQCWKAPTWYHSKPSPQTKAAFSWSACWWGTYTSQQGCGSCLDSQGYGQVNFSLINAPVSDSKARRQSISYLQLTNIPLGPLLLYVPHLFPISCLLCSSLVNAQTRQTRMTHSFGPLLVTFLLCSTLSFTHDCRFTPSWTGLEFKSYK